MNSQDILATIDNAVESRCACGCGAKLDPDGPSQWFASQGCQWRFQQQHARDPNDVYLRPDVAGDYWTAVDQERARESVRIMGEQLTEGFRAIGREITTFFRALAESIKPALGLAEQMRMLRHQRMRDHHRLYRSRQLSRRRRNR